MSSKFIFLIGAFLGLVIVGVWFVSLPEAPKIPRTPTDIGWRTIQKKENGWERGALVADSTGWKSYQKNLLLIYGHGTIPQIDDIDKKITVIDGEWFVRQLDARQKYRIVTPFLEGSFDQGTVFVSIAKKTLMNFDTEFLTKNNELIGPSFSWQDGKQEFFDLGEQQGMIDADSWSLYTIFLPRDQKYIFGSIGKADIDDYVEKSIAREPDMTGDTVMERDAGARNTLEEAKSLISKIEQDIECGIQADTCYLLLQDTLDAGIERFPQVFEPLNRMVQSWIKAKKTERHIALSWREIFALYHDDIVAENPRAKVIRDNAILQLIRTNQTEATYDVWRYLTNMLSKQKLGSAYSIQIMREMIRIGNALSINATSEILLSLRQTAVDSLSNLRTILENTYFTKKDYLFILREDLVDSDGKAIQSKVFVDDLELLVKQIDSSILFETGSSRENATEIQTIRGQLAWFTCILGKNETYIKNPRICRTITQ